MHKAPEIFAFLVFFQIKPGYEEAFIESLPLDLMTEEACFLNSYLMQNQEDPSQFAIYETWACSQDHFLDVEMKRPYRTAYEEKLPHFLLQPREVQKNWRLISCECSGESKKDQAAFFIYFQTKEGKEQEFLTNVSGVLENLIKEPKFTDYFMLQNRDDPTKFFILDVFSGSEEDFLQILRKPKYQHYEQIVPHLLDRPRKREFFWRLLRADSKKKLSIRPEMP